MNKYTATYSFNEEYKKKNKNPYLKQPKDNGMLYITIAILCLCIGLVAFIVGYAMAYIDINHYYYLIWK